MVSARQRPFRHVVRNIYAFEFDPERLGRLARNLPEAFDRVQRDLTAFSQFLERVISDGGDA